MMDRPLDRYYIEKFLSTEGAPDFLRDGVLPAYLSSALHSCGLERDAGRGGGCWW